MPARRQQRRNSARGRAPFKTLATVPALIATIASQAANNIRLSFGAINPAITLQGTPQMLRGFDGSAPINVGWDGSLLTLTYAAPIIQPSETFTLSASDPAFRGSAGEFIGACQLEAAGAIPAPVGNLFASGSALVIGATNVPSTGIATGAAPAGVNVGDIIYVIVPIEFSGGAGITGVASGSPVEAGNSRQWTWDGTAWQL